MNLSPIAVILASFALIACGGGIPPSGKMSPSAMNGVWQVIELSGADAQGKDSFKVKANSDGTLDLTTAIKRPIKMFLTFTETHFKFTNISVADKKYYESSAPYSMTDGTLSVPNTDAKSKSAQPSTTTVKRSGNNIEVITESGKTTSTFTLKRSSAADLQKATSGFIKSSEANTLSLPSKGEFSLSLKSEKSGNVVEFTKSIKSGEGESSVNCSLQKEGELLISLSSRTNWEEEADAYIIIEIPNFPKIREDSFASNKFSFKPDDNNNLWGSGKLFKRLDINNLRSKTGETECAVEASKKADVLTGTLSCSAVTAFSSKEVADLKGQFKASFECYVLDMTKPSVR